MIVIIAGNTTATTVTEEEREFIMHILDCNIVQLCSETFLYNATHPGVTG